MKGARVVIAVAALTAVLLAAALGWVLGGQDKDPHAKVLGWCADDLAAGMLEQGVPPLYIVMGTDGRLQACEEDWREFSGRWEK